MDQGVVVMMTLRDVGGEHHRQFRVSETSRHSHGAKCRLTSVTATFCQHYYLRRGGYVFTPLLFVGRLLCDANIFGNGFLWILEGAARPLGLRCCCSQRPVQSHKKRLPPFWIPAALTLIHVKDFCCNFQTFSFSFSFSPPNCHRESLRFMETELWRLLLGFFVFFSAWWSGCISGVGGYLSHDDWCFPTHILFVCADDSQSSGRNDKISQLDVRVTLKSRGCAKKDECHLS